MRKYLLCYLKLRELSVSSDHLHIPKRSRVIRYTKSLFVRQIEYLSKNDGTNALNYKFENIVEFSKNRHSY